MKRNKVVSKIIVITSCVILWQIAVSAFRIPGYIFPSPLEVLLSWINNRQIILSNSAITLSEASLGFLIANVVSVTIAITISFFRRIEEVVMPLAIVIKTMPIIVLTPLLALWFGSGIAPKVVAAMLVCFFPALVNVLEGARALDRKLIWLFKIYSANKFQMIGKLILPSILPYLFAAFKTSSSLAVVGALVSEFISSNKGLGFVIISNYYNMRTSLVFAAIITSSIIGISFYYLLDFLEKQMSFSEEKIKEARDQKAPASYKYLERR